MTNRNLFPYTDKEIENNPKTNYIIFTQYNSVFLAKTIQTSEDIISLRKQRNENPRYEVEIEKCLTECIWENNMINETRSVGLEEVYDIYEFNDFETWKNENPKDYKYLTSNEFQKELTKALENNIRLVFNPQLIED